MGRIFSRSQIKRRRHGRINEEAYTLATESEDPPMQQEIAEIIRKLKNNKSPGENEGTAEMLEAGIERLEEYIHMIIKKGKIGEGQAGFTAGRSCIDHIYTIQQLIRKKKAKNTAIHLAFIDIRKAYDSILREKLWKATKEIDINKKLISADDQIIMAQAKEDLSYMIRKLREEYTEARLEIHMKKT
ncbi:hypothetical protein ILUMI_01102 [Ignelater luminosus]|uniref:Reverse transcriptase domain-containing protein n=1 Tax=Ignelater luminosus TaxID=2038154 RepID=A0A8K0DJ53_IGNLU|nr:hypothetical protein ILUMI_01102 [Ignelater luminosus]